MKHLHDELWHHAYEGGGDAEFDVTLTLRLKPFCSGSFSADGLASTINHRLSGTLLSEAKVLGIKRIQLAPTETDIFIR